MRISARNQIKGSVVEVKKGATTSHVRVDIGGGQIVTSSITNDAVDDLACGDRGRFRRPGRHCRLSCGPCDVSDRSALPRLA